MEDRTRDHTTQAARKYRRGQRSGKPEIVYTCHSGDSRVEEVL